MMGYCKHCRKVLQTCIEDECAECTEIDCEQHSWYIKSGMLTDLMVCEKCGKEERRADGRL